MLVNTIYEVRQLTPSRNWIEVGLLVCILPLVCMCKIQGSPIIFEISLLFTLYWPHLRRGLILFTVYCYVSKTSVVLFTEKNSNSIRNSITMYIYSFPIYVYNNNNL